jgi:hypothetical protein
MPFLPRAKKWVTNLFGYDYEIIYKKGKDNVVVDALSENTKMKGPFLSLLQCTGLAPSCFPRMVT